jgi:hypothetical protein
VSTPGISDDPGRDALLSWLKQRLNTDLPLTPGLLWHYTDAGGLMGILEHESLWATQTSFLNDSTELAHGIHLATKTLASYSARQVKEVTARFLGRLVDPEQAALAGWLDRNLDVYVVCFCGDGDLLSQWRAYAGGDDAGGYAIGMGTRPPLQGWPQTAPGGHDFALRRVLYDPAEQEAACRALIDALVPVLDDDPTDVDRQKSFAKNLVNGVVELASWCKHPSFEEEQEWRIVYVRNNDSSKLPVRHRQARGLVVPYVVLDLPSPVAPMHGHLPIQAVNVGPGPEPDLKRRGLQSLLANYPHYGAVTVEGSSAPLRL